MRRSLASTLVLALVMLGTLPVLGQQAEPPSSAAVGPLPLPLAPPADDAATTGNRAECDWLGQRTVRVLLRDDLIAAEGFFAFYRAFGCPSDHLGRAFACAIPAAEVEEAQALQKHAAACWADPSTELNIEPAQNNNNR